MAMLYHGDVGYQSFLCSWISIIVLNIWERRGCYRMVVGFTTTCAIGVYHNYSCVFTSS